MGGMIFQNGGLRVDKVPNKMNDYLHATFNIVVALQEECVIKPGLKKKKSISCT